MTIVLNPSSQLINISSFPGVSFLDTWVHVKKMIDFDPSCPTVLVVGSVLEFVGSSRKLLARDQLLDLCKGLATSLTAFDFNIVNGACPGLPDDVMREFQAIRSRGITIGLSAYPDPHNHTLEKTFAPGGFPITADVTVFCGTGFELLNVLNTLCIDLVVTIGGGVGTLLEIASAVEQELPVLCLGTSGGISQEAEELLRRYLAAFKHFELRTVPTLHELHTQLEAFASKFRLESRTTRMAPLLAEIAANPGQKPHSIKISFNTDEDVIHYGYSGETVALHNPRVVTDRIRLARIPIRGDIILHSLEEVARDYVIDGISLRLSARQQQRIWGPSIDTLIILQVLREHRIDGNARVFDIGTGCGLLAIWLVATGRAQDSVGIDVARDAIYAAKWNASNLLLTDKCVFQNTSFERWDHDCRKFDVVLCNPPYLPLPHPDMFNENTYGGTDLLYNVLVGYESYLAENGHAHIVASSASYIDRRIHDRLAELQRAGVAKKSGTKFVPLNVSGVLRNAEWLRFLVDRGAISLREDDYHYWHSIDIWSLGRSSQH